MNQSSIDIIGDVHGMYGRLSGLLARLGYHRDAGSWRHSENRRVVFVGDYVDRGSRSKEVIETVQQMCHDRIALALLGNHDTNAIAFCTLKATGVLDAQTAWKCREGSSWVDSRDWLREHNKKNVEQHRDTLKAFKEPSEYEAAIGYFQTLPIWLELPGLRVVHAAWIPHAIDKLDQYANSRGSDGLGIRAACIDEAIEMQAGRAYPSPAQWRDLLEMGETKAFLQSANASPPIALERLVKGVEMALPPGVSFKDGSGHERSEMRIRWFDAAEGQPYHRHALMRPHDVIGIQAKLPHELISASKGDHAEAPLPQLIPFHAIDAYPFTERPVLFGHYALYDIANASVGRILRPNVACVDTGGGYSAKQGGSLSAYRWDGERELHSSKFIVDRSSIDKLACV